jgi:hypothetical protein
MDYIMKYEEVSKLSDEKFKRIVGIKKRTFKLMMKIVSFSYAVKHELGGKPDRIPLEDKLLMALNYWREYRTYAHLGVTYGYSESQTCRIIRWCEDVLINSGKFTVGGKRELLSINPDHVVLIDATESPIQRPKKKAEEILFRKEKKAHNENTTCYK